MMADPRELMGVFCELAAVNTGLLGWMAWSFAKSSNAFLEMVWDDAESIGFAKGRAVSGPPPSEAHDVPPGPDPTHRT